MNEGMKWKVGVDVEGEQYWLTIDGLKKGSRAKPLHWKELADAIDIVVRWRQDDLWKLGTIELWLVRNEYADLLVASWKK